MKVNRLLPSRGVNSLAVRARPGNDWFEWKLSDSMKKRATQDCRVWINGVEVDGQVGEPLTQLQARLPELAGRDLLFLDGETEVDQVVAGQRLSTQERFCIHSSPYQPGHGYLCGRC